VVVDTTEKTKHRCKCRGIASQGPLRSVPEGGKGVSHADIWGKAFQTEE
jgi:hypothetical protein